MSSGQPPFMENLLMKKEGPCSPGAHSPATQQWLGQPPIDRQTCSSFTVSQEALVHFTTDGQAEGIFPLELPFILALSVKGQ